MSTSPFFLKFIAGIKDDTCTSGNNVEKERDFASVWIDHRIIEWFVLEGTLKII